MPYMIQRFWRVVCFLSYVHIITALVATYFAFWLTLLLTEAPGAKIVEPVGFWYFWWTTALTIGYGDLAPTSALARLVTPIFQVASVIIGTTMIGKTITVVVDQLGKWRRGLMPTQEKNHVIIVGDFHPQRTMQLLGNLTYDRSDDSVSTSIICAFRNTGDKNPFEQYKDLLNGHAPEYHQIGSEGVTRRTFADINAAEAAHIYVMYNDDISAVGFIGALSRVKTNAHIALLLREPENAELVPRTSLNIRVIHPVQPYLAVREMEDPGTGAIVSQLMDVTKEGSLFSVDIRGLAQPYSSVRAALKSVCPAGMPIGYVVPHEGDWQSFVTPSDDALLPRGSRLVYIAPRDLTGEQEASFRKVLE